MTFYWESLGKSNYKNHYLQLCCTETCTEHLATNWNVTVHTHSQISVKKGKICHREESRSQHG